MAIQKPNAKNPKVNHNHADVNTVKVNQSQAEQTSAVDKQQSSGGAHHQLHSTQQHMPQNAFAQRQQSLINQPMMGTANMYNQWNQPFQQIDFAVTLNDTLFDEGTLDLKQNLVEILSTSSSATWIGSLTQIYGFAHIAPVLNTASTVRIAFGDGGEQSYRLIESTLKAVGECAVEALDKNSPSVEIIIDRIDAFLKAYKRIVHAYEERLKAQNELSDALFNKSQYEQRYIFAEILQAKAKEMYGAMGDQQMSGHPRVQGDFQNFQARQPQPQVQPETNEGSDQDPKSE